MDWERYRKATPLLDFEHPHLVRLAEERDWRRLREYDRIGAIYDFVRDEILPGYNESDCDYAVATTHFKSPPVARCVTDTAIQREAIIQDLGDFDTPDDFFAQFGTRR